MATLGDLVVNLTANTNPLSRNLSRGRATLASFAGQAARLLAPLAGAFTLGASVNEAREAIAAERKLEAVLNATGGAAGRTADQIKALASQRQSLTNFGDDATIAGAAVLATFKEIKGQTFDDAIVAAQDLSAVMGQDLQSSVVQIGKALNDPIKGVTALQRVGVSFTTAQKDQIKALQESGNLMGAQAIILRELQSEFGGAAEAMADPLTQFRNTIGDLGEAIGKFFLPTLNVLAKAFVAVFSQGVAGANGFGLAIQNVLNNMTLKMIEVLPNGEQLFQDLGTVVIAVWDGIVAGADAMWSRLKNGFLSIADIAQVAGSAIAASFDAALNFEDPIEAAKQAIVDGLASLPEREVRHPVDEFMAAFNKTTDDAARGFAESGGLKKMLETSTSAIQDELKGTIFEIPEFKAPANFLSVPDEQSADDSKKAAGKQSDNAALARGSAEAFNAIVAAMSGKNANAQQNTANNTKKANEHLAAVKQELRRGFDALLAGEMVESFL